MSTYTPEQTKEIVAEYVANPTLDTAKTIAERINKSTKSVVSKLAFEGVYVKTTYKTKTGENVVTKAELVADFAENVGVDVEALVGLEKAPKAVLKTIVNATTVVADSE